MINLNKPRVTTGNLIKTNNIQQTGHFALYDGRYWVDLLPLMTEGDPDAIHNEDVIRTIRTITRILIAAIFIPIFIGAVLDRYYVVIIVELGILIWLRKALHDKWDSMRTAYDMRRHLRETNKLYHGSVVSAGYRRQVIKTENGDALKEYCILQCEFETGGGTREETVHFSLDQDLPESIRECFSGLIPDDGQAEVALEMPMLVGRGIIFQYQKGQYSAEYLEITQTDYEHGIQSMNKPEQETETPATETPETEAPEKEQETAVPETEPAPEQNTETPAPEQGQEPEQKKEAPEQEPEAKTEETPEKAPDHEEPEPEKQQEPAE